MQGPYNNVLVVSCNIGLGNGLVPKGTVLIFPQNKQAFIYPMQVPGVSSPNRY